jgi:hypothetical protein
MIVIAHPVMFTTRYFLTIVTTAPATKANGAVMRAPGRKSDRSIVSRIFVVEMGYIPTADRIGDAPKQAWKKTRRKWKRFSG